MSDPATRVRLEMGYSHRDILRLLPSAIEGRRHAVAGREITVEDGARRVRIRLGDERRRRMGPSLQLPVTEVELCFEGFAQIEAERFVERFRLHYQRGGG